MGCPRLEQRGKANRVRIRMSLASTVIACIATAVMSCPRAAFAQADSRAWPQRTVRFIVPFGPGAASDIAARLLAGRLQQVWGTPVIVENRPGGDGLVSIGTFVTAKDDHTLFLTPTTTFLVHPYTQGNLPYDCGFRRCRPGIPIEVGHLFRSKSATHSGDVGHPLGVMLSCRRG